MSVAETAELAVRLSMQDNLSPGLGKISSRMSSLGKIAQTAIGTGIGLAFDRAAAAALRFGTSAFSAGIEGLKTLDTVTTQTAAAIKATGGAAGETADEIRTLAKKYEELNYAFDDKAIQDAENRLLRFTAIGKSNFEPTLRAALDLSAALGKDLPSAVTALGKALSDPTKGIGVLKKFGVIIDTDTQAKIKEMQAAGDFAGAQAEILKAIEKRYAGAFEAGGNTAAGATAKFRDSIEDLQMAFATGLLPVVTNIQTKLADWLGKPETLRTVENLGKSIGALFSNANLDALAGGLTAAAGAFGTALDVFAKLPAPLQGILIAAIGAKKFLGIGPGDIIGGAKGLLGGIFDRGGTPASPMYTYQVNTLGGVGAGGGVAGAPVAAGGKNLLQKVAVVGSVLIAGASIIALAEQFKSFIDDVGTAQADLRSRVDSAANQDFAASMANLRGVTSQLNSMDIGDRILAATFGGAEITKDFVDAAQRLLAQATTKADLEAAKAAITTALKTARDNNLTGAIGPLEAILKSIDSKLGLGGKTGTNPIASAIEASVTKMAKVIASLTYIDKTKPRLGPPAPDYTKTPATPAISVAPIVAAIGRSTTTATSSIGSSINALRSPLAQIPAAVNGIGPRVASATSGALVGLRTTFGAVGNQIAGALRSDAGARARAEAASSARLTGLANAIKNQAPPTTSILNQTTIPIKVYVNGKLQTNVQTSYRSGTTVRGRGNARV